MIPLTFLEYELTEKPEMILNNLNWSVEEIEASWLDFSNLKPSPATQKPWIGQIDRINLAFSLEEPGPFIKRTFNVVLKGRLELRVSTTNIRIKIGLDNFSFAWILTLYLGGALFMADAFTNKEFDSYFTLIFFLVAYPILGTFLIRKRMKRAEKKLDHMFL